MLQKSSHPTRGPSDAHASVPARAIVIFGDSIVLPYVDGAEHYLKGPAADTFQELQGRFPGITLRRLFNSVPAERLDELVERARRLDPEYRGVDLKKYFRVDAPVRESASELARGLGRIGSGTKAYVEGVPGPPPSISLDPRSGTQQYLQEAPHGIAAVKVWNAVPGGDGSSVTFVDLEEGWTLEHDDLPQFSGSVAPIYGLNLAERGHGMAVLGVLVAAVNSRGCVGIVPRANAGLVSIWETATSHNMAGAILAALDSLTYGDVLLLEETVSLLWAPAWPGLPVEAHPANFDLIRLATALGIAVVEAAGNMDYDLDTYSDAGQFIFARAPNPARPGFKDSGAILVAGAMEDPVSGKWIRLNTTPTNTVFPSSYGSRIDCFAQGLKVGTIGELGPLVNQPDLYLPASGMNDEFSGTSAASAIVAGAAIATQGMVHAATGGQRLSALQMRAVLSTVGTASKAGERIGVMPNLEAIAALLPDLVVRDYAGDTGDPHAGPLARSPDIIVRQTQVPNPTIAFGEGSGTENDETLSDDVVAGQDHYVYIRLKNRGRADAAGARARVYWSLPSSLVTPASWNLIGEVTIGNVVHDGKLNVTPAIVWPAAAIPSAGHYCFVALVGDSMDPMPWEDDLRDWAHFERFIRDVNNVTWRNFNVVVPPSPPPIRPAPLSATLPARAPRPEEHALSFWLTGPELEEKVMSLEILTIPATGCTLRLEGPADVVAKTRVLWLRPLIERLARTIGRGSLRPVGRMRLGDFSFPAGYRESCRLLVGLSGNALEQPVDVIVRQLFEKREVGRITWRILPRR